MFDVGFFELALIGIVALLVIGPDRLPTVAKTAGKWVGRARRFVSNVKQDIDQEIQAEELKKALNQDNLNLTSNHSIIEETKQAFEEVKKETEAVVNAVQPDQAKQSNDKPDSP